MKFKNIITVSILTLLVSGIALTKNKPIEKVSAATPMPSNINATNSTDAQVSAYYDGVEGKSGDQLLAFLHTKIKDHNEYSYDNTTHRTIYKIIDRNWDIDPLTPTELSNFDYTNDNGFIRKLYADYNDNTATADRFKNAGASRVSFDKEHVWAQSLGGFGRDVGAGSDFHALLPADIKGNQQAHSNYNFAVPTSGITSYNNDKGTYVGRNGYIPASSTHKVFEPLDQYKGDIARAMFYMPARYYEYIDDIRFDKDNNEYRPYPKLELVNGSPDDAMSSPTKTGKAGDLATLLEWHEMDPVDEYEIRRNNLIANNYQMNRNPFIDYPQWARIAYDPTYTGAGASNAAETSSVGTLGGGGNVGNVLTGITLDTTNAKTEYYEGEKFSTNSLIVTAHFGDGTSCQVLNYTSSIANGTVLSALGNQTVTISYTHEEVTKTANYTITVQEVILSEFLFISEAYGGGGNAGSFYTHDFIELFNYATFPISLDGLSLQYASATGSTWSKLDLTGEIAPKTYFLVQHAKGNGGTQSLPTPEAIGSFNMAGSGFKVALVESTTPLSGTNPLPNTAIIDFVGAGSSASAYYGSQPTSSPSNTTSIHRKFIKNNNAPPAMSDRDNYEDYVVDTPTPTNKVVTIAVDIMRTNEEGQCVSLYHPYKNRVLSLTEIELSEWINGTDPQLVMGRNRYEAWARYFGDEPYIMDDNFGLGNDDNRLAETEIAYLILSVGIFALSLGLYFMKSRNNPAKSH
ncbi:MAG: endonuclease [Bacilli bacterium]|jgi:endonuclease I